MRGAQGVGRVVADAGRHGPGAIRGCALLGTGIGLDVCGIAGEIVIKLGFPFRMMWFTPLVGLLGVVPVSIAAVAISVRPVVTLQPAVVFAGC